MDQTEPGSGPEGIAVFDIDGVVADVRHRLHHLEGRRHDWAAFFDAADHDPPLPTGLALVGELAARHRIVWLTGRPDWLRRTTRTWLAAAGLPTEELLMRGSGDYRPARVMKVQQLRRLATRDTVAAFVDDDPEVIDAALAAGFPAQLADWIVRSTGEDRTLRAAQEDAGRT